MPRKSATTKAVEKAAQRSAEKALMEERLAIGAIVKVFLSEVPDMARIVLKVEAMVRRAEADPKVPARARQSLLDAQKVIQAAVDRELGKPQTLFDPHVAHIKPAAVAALAEGPPDGEQMGLLEVGSAHQDRVDTVSKAQKTLVGIYQDKGSLTDAELFSQYTKACFASPGQVPSQSFPQIRERRKELTNSGRVLATGEKRNGAPVWGLIEKVVAA